MPQVTLINVDKIQENFDELYNRSDDRVVVVVKGDKKLFLVKECDTKNGDDCTHMESDDGSSTVNVNNNSSNKNTEIDDDKDDVLIPTPHASSAAKIALIEQKKIIKEQQHSFIEEIKVFFKSIFETLTLKF